jgi:hypothetical protein
VSSQLKTVEFLPFKMAYIYRHPDSSEAEAEREHNRQLLRNGIEEQKYTGVHTVSPAEFVLYKEYLPPFSKMGSVELYANGSKNIFVKDARDETDPDVHKPFNVAFGFIKVRVQ